MAFHKSASKLTSQLNDAPHVAIAVVFFAGKCLVWPLLYLQYNVSYLEKPRLIFPFDNTHQILADLDNTFF